MRRRAVLSERDDLEVSEAEDAIESVGATARRVLGRYQERIVDGLRASIEYLPIEICDPARYHLGLEPGARPGKALRPTLTMLIAEGLDGDPEWAQHLGVAVQLIHDFSLVHDDIVD